MTYSPRLDTLFEGVFLFYGQTFTSAADYFDDLILPFLTFDNYTQSREGDGWEDQGEHEIDVYYKGRFLGRLYDFNGYGSMDNKNVDNCTYFLIDCMSFMAPYLITGKK